MKTIKVSEASPLQLDWLVAKLNGDFELYHNLEEGQRFLNVWTGSAFLKYSSSWGCGGPIIENHIARIEEFDEYWEADCVGHTERGPTPLIAAMRCFIASKMGDTVEIPEELG